MEKRDGIKRRKARNKRKKKAVRLQRIGLLFSLIFAAAILCALIYLHQGEDEPRGAIATPAAAFEAAPTVNPSRLKTPAPTQTPTPAQTPNPTSTPTLITISAAGDCTLGGDPRSNTKTAFKRALSNVNGDFSYFFREVRTLFEEDDITIVNLEGALTEATQYKKNKQFCFSGHPSYAQILSEGGVEVCNVDNNHIDDFYSAGYKDTLSALEAENIGYCGRGTTYVTEVKGVRVGFCGFREWNTNAEAVDETVKALKQDCDLVIVSFHWGEERVGQPTKKQISLGHAAVDSGADLVLGHHPHVVGGIEVYGGKYIVYSLANFCFGGNTNPSDKDTFIFQQTFEVTEDGIKDAGINVIPCRVSGNDKINDYQPVPVSGDAAETIYKKIEAASQKLAQPADIR